MDKTKLSGYLFPRMDEKVSRDVVKVADRFNNLSSEERAMLEKKYGCVDDGPGFEFLSYQGLYMLLCKYS